MDKLVKWNQDRKDVALFKVVNPVKHFMLVNYNSRVVI